ncbi:MAG: hypothetical protein R3E39_08120 [Anaerolineae bacterium]
MSEPSAALASLQRHAPSFPPANAVNSAPHSLIPARHLGGNIATKHHPS